MDVLMAYATKNGSTRQVAEYIAAAMRAHDARVTIAAAKSARERIAGYDLIVLGAPLYSGRWHHDARGFLRRHRRELPGVPVVVFGMGPRNDTEDAWQRSRAQLGKALARYRWLAPAEVTVFGGVNPPGRASKPHRDLRDWQLIQAWAITVLHVAARGDTWRPRPTAAEPSGR